MFLRRSRFTIVFLAIVFNFKQDDMKRASSQRNLGRSRHPFVAVPPDQSEASIGV
jgi:hypothetical protein